MEHKTTTTNWFKLLLHFYRSSSCNPDITHPVRNHCSLPSHQFGNVNTALHTLLPACGSLGVSLGY